MAKNKIKSTSGHFPLQHYVEQLTSLFQQARGSRNPALFLYRHDARTPLFMAESIMRLLERLPRRDGKTAKGLKTFKKLEDNLGQVDYYDQLVKQFSKIRSVKEEQLDYFISRRDKQLEKLNERLRRKHFYTEIFSELLGLCNRDFNRATLIFQLRKEMQKELKACYDYYMIYPKVFTDLESEVHEIRRKLRWISIYAQSLQGIVALKSVSRNYKWEKEFITRNSPNSSYNKLTVRHDLRAHIVLNQKSFYALGTVIDALGQIKDRGLALEAFEKMLKKMTASGHGGNFEEMTVKQLRLGYHLKDVMKEAHQLLYQFFVKYRIQKELFLKSRF